MVTAMTLLTGRQNAVQVTCCHKRTRTKKPQNNQLMSKIHQSTYRLRAHGPSEKYSMLNYISYMFLCINNTADKSF